MSSRPQPPPALADYLARNRFTPAPGHLAWHDHPTPGGIIRVVRDEEAETCLIALTSSIACRYHAMFHFGTPDAVIIAAVEAALSMEPGAPATPGAGPPPRTRASRRSTRGDAGR